MTGTEIVTAALEDMGILGIGETAETAHATKGFSKLGQLLASWHTDGIEVPVVTWINFSLVAGTASYTIGESGTPDKDTTRPDSVRGAFIRDSSSTDHALTKMTEDEYRRYSSKGDSGRPTGFWYNDTVPNGTLYVVPTPNTVETIHLFCSSPMAEPASASADVIIPRGYDLGIVSNLVVELAPAFGLEVTNTQAVNVRNHRKAMKELTAKNKINPPRIYVTSVGQAYSIIEGGSAPEALLLE